MYPLFNIFLSDYCSHLKEKTITSYESIINTRINKKLGKIRLQELKTYHIQKFINNLVDVKPKTIKNIYGVLNKGLNKAVKLQLIKNNPCDSVTIPKVAKPEIRVFTDEELEILFKALKKHPFYNFYLIALFTGMRRAELLALTWDCYKPEYGYIRVYRQLQIINGEYKFIIPKNGKPRNVVLPQVAIEIIDSLDDNKSDFIFHDEKGEHLSYYQVGHVFRKIIKTLDIPVGTLHDLRHTYAVTSLRAGDNVKNVQTNMGHSTPAFTLERYATVTSDMINESREKLQNQFKKLNI